MAKIIHIADLHLSAKEKDYGFSVLEEIIGLTVAEKAEFLLIAGDLFDSFPDLKALRADFASAVKRLKGSCEVLFIPGNHDSLRKGAREGVELMDLGEIKKFVSPPFGLHEAGGLEFVCVPHAGSYDGYRDWGVPEKAPGRARVVMMHGLNSSIYAGPEGEDDARAGVIDDDLFARFGADYAALGHVHGSRQQRFGLTLAAYPGSARVWRAHDKEAGPRGVIKVEIAPGRVSSPEFVPLASAGRFRSFEVPLGLDGAPDAATAARLKAETGKADLVSVSVCGTVDSEQKASEAEKALEMEISPLARRYETGRRDITVVGDISRNPLAARFLAEMEKLRPAPGSGEAEQKKWLLARRFGCEAVASRLKGAA